MAFNDLVTRSDAVADLPHALANELITGVSKASTVLSLGRVIVTDTRDSRIPVLSYAPEGYWVGGDTGLKSTSKFVFDDQVLIAEEIAAIVPVPDAVLDDSEFQVWEQLRPLLVRAVARRLDRSVLFGLEKPASWQSLSLLDDAIAAGNTITANTDDDPVENLLAAAELVANDGYIASGSVVRRGWQYKAATVRSRDLVANPAGASSPYPLTVAGLGIYTDPPYWQPTAAESIVADWSNVIIGMRSDVKLEMFTSGVITDETGHIVLNLMQQDASACRCTCRVGYLLAKPVTDADTVGSPVSAVVPAGSSS